MVSNFKDTHLFEKRKAEPARIKQMYPDRIPKAGRMDVPTLVKKKYLVPFDLTVGQFVYVIRNRIKLSLELALFIFVGGGVHPPVAALMSAIYEDHKDQDDFLYISYSGENAFGQED